MVIVDGKKKRAVDCWGRVSSIVVVLLLCITASGFFSPQNDGTDIFMQAPGTAEKSNGIDILMQAPGAAEKIGCCLPCQIPNGECCLTCQERSPETERNVLMALMEALTIHIDTKHLKDHPWLATRAWEGLSHIGNRVNQATFYYDWARSKIPKNSSSTRVCEIGFNGGHSAGIFLASTPRTTNLTVFDLGYFKYSPTALNFIERVFPGRVEFNKGSSYNLVPAFSKSHGRVCDIFSVDGNHTSIGAKIDIVNAIQATRVGGWIIMDDTKFTQGPRVALEEVITENPDLLSEKKCVEVEDKVSRLNRYDTSDFRQLFPIFCWMQVLK